MGKILLLIFLFFIQSCSPKILKVNYSGEIRSGNWLRNLKVNYVLKGDQKEKFYVPLQIYFPKNYQRGDNSRTIIALPSYNGLLKDWEENTNIEYLANEYNLVLVCPQMGRTVYETKFYPETKVKWSGIPGTVFIGEKLIPYLRDNFALAGDRSKTGILGVSTGARGAILASSVYHDLFGAAAGLSGNYDALAMTNNKTLISVYGEYRDFKERWLQDDNILELSKNLENTSLFLWHGQKDYVVSHKQSIIFVMRLRQYRRDNGGGYEVIFKEKKYSSYGWRYWKRMVPEVMDFFDKKLKKD